MKTLASLLLLTNTLFAATPAPEPMTPPPPMPKGSTTSSYLLIPVKDRATDLQQAFEQLKREKTAGKVYFQLADGTSISNIIDMNLMPSNSLILFRYNTTNNQGIRMQIVKVEDILGVSYQ